MPKYLFEGSQMYEVGDDGQKKAVSSLYSGGESRRTGFQPRSGPAHVGYQGHQGHGYYGHNYRNTYTYTPIKVYAGVDRKKWPHAWQYLVRFSVVSDHKDTRWVEDAKWRAMQPAEVLARLDAEAEANRISLPPRERKLDEEDWIKYAGS